MEVIIKNSISGSLARICEIVTVVSNKPGAAGINKAKTLGVPCIIIESKGKKREDFDAELLSVLKPMNIEHIILAGFNRVLSPIIISAYKNRIINIHPADSKVYQGLHGYRWAYENLFDKTKITVHLVDEGVDTGRILAQTEIDLNGCSSLEDVEALGLAIENVFYSEVLEKYFNEKI